MTEQFSGKTKRSTIETKLTLFIVMGVSGSGKTSIAKALTTKLNEEGDFVFIDADDLHSLEAKRRMMANLPLDNVMRKPWLSAMSAKLNELNGQHKSVVLAFSGLKKQHRNSLRKLNFNCHFFYLTADIEVIQSRIVKRENHFFSPLLLASQFEAMEPISDDEEDISIIDVSTTFENISQEIIAFAQQKQGEES